MPFAWSKRVIVGWAFAMYGRHAAGGERVSQQGLHLVVEQETADLLKRADR